MGISKGKVFGPRKLFLFGDHGLGKTTLASQAFDPLFIDIEEGSKDLDVARWDEPIKNYGKFVEVMNWVYSERHEFKTLVIDSGDFLERLLFNDIAGKAGVAAVTDIDYGRGLPRAIPMWQSVLNMLQSIHRDRKMMIIIISHAKIEHVKNPEGQDYDRFAPGLYTDKNGAGAGKIVQEWADEVFFIRKKKFIRTEDAGFNKTRGIAIGTEERELLTSDSAFACAKNRLGMPPIVSVPGGAPALWSEYLKYIMANKPSQQVAPPGMATIETRGDLEGVIVDGSSKVPNPELEEAKRMLNEGLV
jgi:hypothetical protein